MTLAVKAFTTCIPLAKKTPPNAETNIPLKINYNARCSGAESGKKQQEDDGLGLVWAKKQDFVLKKKRRGKEREGE